MTTNNAELVDDIIIDYQNGMTVHDIEKKHDINSSKIYYQLKKNNVKLYKKYNLPTYDIHNDYMCGLPIEEIEIKYGLYILMIFPVIKFRTKNHHSNIKQLGSNDGIMICSDSKIDINNLPIYEIIDIYNGNIDRFMFTRKLKIKYNCDVITNILNINEIIWYVKEYYNDIKTKDNLIEIFKDNLWLKKVILNYVNNGITMDIQNQQLIYIEYNDKNFMLRCSNRQFINNKDSLIII